MKYTVNVNSSAIRHGKAGDCNKCPIALAVARVVAKNDLPFNRVGVGGGITLTYRTKRLGEVASLGLDLTPRAAGFIERFDEHKQVKPFTFTLSIPKAELAAVRARINGARNEMRAANKAARAAA